MSRKLAGSGRRRTGVLHRVSRQSILFVCVAILHAATSGCTTTAKLNSFSELSRVGVAYVEAANAVIEQAAEGSIAADTATLLVTREDLPSASRLTALKSQSAGLRKQLGLLGDIRRHQGLVKEYFVSLGALADAGDADSAIGTAASGTITALGQLSEGFKDLKVGQQPIAAFAGQAVPLVVANLRSRALEQELRAHGANINRELVISEGLMAFLAEKIQADDAAVQGPKEADAVFIPYANDGPLPSGWPQMRAAFLQRAADLQSVSTAQDAARKLRLALAAAAEGTIAPGQLQLLVNDLSNLVDVLENVRRKPQPQGQPKE